MDNLFSALIFSAVLDLISTRYRLSAKDYFG